MRTITLCASDFVICDQEIYFVPLNIPALIKADIKLETPLRMVALPITCGYFGGFFEKLLLVDNTIVGIPYWAEQYLLYNLEEKKLKTISVPEKLRDINGMGYYASGVYENIVFSTIRFQKKNKDLCSTMLCLDTTADSLAEEKLSCIDFMCIDYWSNIAVRRESAQVGSNLYLLSGVSNEIVVYDMKNKTTELFAVLEKETRFTTIELIDEEKPVFLLSDNLGRIVVWEKNHSRTEVINIDIDGFATANFSEKRNSGENFSFSCKNGDKIFIFPYFANRILCYDINDHSIYSVFDDALCIDDLEKYFELDDSFCGQFSEPHVLDDKIYVWNIWKREFLVLNTTDGSVVKKELTLELDNKTDAEMFSVYSKNLPLVFEGDNGIAQLNTFINYTCEG